jgi:LysR family hydrogen peroxide-inducible transcriptional activator
LSGARQVRLTRFGEDLSARVQGILRQVDEIGDMARAAQDRLAGRLRLGVIPTIAPYLLPRVIHALGDAYPELDLYVRETITPKLIDELGDGRLDAAIVALPISEPWLEETVLFDERFVLIRPASEEGRPVPDGDALREMELLLLEEGHCFRDQALEFCGLRRNQPSEGLDGSSLSTLVQMVGAGIGVTLIPEMALHVEARMADISVARFADPAPQRTVGMVWRRSNPLAGQLRSVAQLVEGLAPASGPGSPGAPRP